MDLLSMALPTPLALAAVALIGYLFGRHKTRRVETDITGTRREMKRALAVIKEMESVAAQLRQSLASHHSSVSRFKERVASLKGKGQPDSWRDLCDEAEAMLGPTMDLATKIARAYDEIRRQTNSLMTFSEVRTDPLTTLSNRRALDESLSAMFAMMSRYDKIFSVVIFDIDHFKRINDEQGHLAGDQTLRDLAQLLDHSARDTDLVARYGGEEFVLVLPETDLAGASVLAGRLCAAVREKLPITVSGGVAMGLDGDNPRTLLARADAALYSAKSAGRDCVYCHTGGFIEPIKRQLDGPPSSEPHAATESGLDDPAVAPSAPEMEASR